MAHEAPSVFVVAAEASGDWAGSLLAAALRQRRPELRVRGVGGRRMAQAGVELAADSSRWGAIGIADALRKAPAVWLTLRRVSRLLAREPPSALVLIDAGGVNIPLLRMTRPLAVKRLYYLPPGSWSRRPRGRALRDLVDVIATPFPWSAELLSGGRARAEWVGHPVLESARPRASKAEAWRRFDLDPQRPVIALAPGSRDQEMRHVLPLVAASAGLLAKNHPGAQFLVPVSHPAHEDLIRRAFAAAGVQPRLLQGMDYDALQLARVAAVCSGTATLEFACLGVPMVIVYRAGLGTALQYLLVRGLIGRQRRAGLPNIIAQQDIVRELVWRDATPRAVAAELSSLLSDGARWDRMRADLAAVRDALGDGSASSRTADLVLELIPAGTPEGEDRR